LLTTHFIKVCKTLKKNKDVINCCMVTTNVDNRLIYSYKLDKGISNVKGGINILTEMDYPSEIINDTIKNRLNHK
jgi:DNA mismatch repair ATPase MutS